MKRGPICVGIFLVMILCGCNPTSMIQRFASPEDENVAKYYIGLLRTGDFGPIERDMDPSLKGPGLHDGLVTAADLIPRQDPTSVKLVGAYTNRGADLRQTNLTYEYQFPDKWLLINVATQQSASAFTIIGLRVQPLADSIEHFNRFTLSRKTPLQYGILTLGVITSLFILYSLILCIRAKNLSKKWLWIIFIIFGFGEFSVNWATGKFGFSPLYFQVFGFSALAAPFGPWIVSVSFPLGAIIYLLRRKRAEPTDTHIAS